MSKYTPEQLKEMAKMVVIADASGDNRVFNLYIIIAMRTGIDANDVRARIRGLSCGE